MKQKVYLWLSASLLGCCLRAEATPPCAQAAMLSERPLVMRISKDEFRIAFGLNVHGCVAHGCNGTISYRVEWLTDNGERNSELRRVRYSVPPRYTRGLTVDRQYFDTAEGAHTTAVVEVTVRKITCLPGTPLAADSQANTDSP
jgi:hypothetical protein